MKEIVIREGSIDDLDAALTLIQELAIYEKAEGEVITDLESMKRDGFGEHPAFGFFCCRRIG